MQVHERSNLQNVVRILIQMADKRKKRLANEQKKEATVDPGLVNSESTVADKPLSQELNAPELYQNAAEAAIKSDGVAIEKNAEESRL